MMIQHSKIRKLILEINIYIMQPFFTIILLYTNGNLFNKDCEPLYRSIMVI